MSSPKTIIVTAVPFGFGSVGTAILIMSELQRSTDARIVYASGDFCSEIAHLDGIEHHPVANERDVDELRNVFSSYDHPHIVSCFNAYAIRVAKEMVLPCAIVDGLAWFWTPGPYEDYLAADIYFANNFIGIERVTRRHPQIRVVPFFSGPRYQTKDTNTLLIHVGGVRTPLEDDLPCETLDISAEALRRWPNAGKMRALVAGGKEAVGYMGEQVNRSDVQFVTLPHDQFLKELSGATRFVTTPGLTATMEAFDRGIPTSFLPPLNLSQWANVLELDGAGAAPVHLTWSKWLPGSCEFHNLPEHESGGIFHDLGRQLANQPARRAQAAADIANLFDQIPDSTKQRKLVEAVGTGGERVICQQLKEEWRL